MGMRGLQVIGRVELPLAVPTIMAGVRTAAINIIATAALASLAGLSTLGDLILGRNVYGDQRRGRRRHPDRTARARRSSSASPGFSGCSRPGG